MCKRAKLPAVTVDALTRRQFLAPSVGLAAAAALPLPAAESSGLGGPRLRAAIVGYTSRGDYGHGLDLI